MEELDSTLIDWGTARLTFAEQNESGDRALVKPFPGGFLAAVVDGLGHGQEAAGVAKVAIETLEQHAGEPVIALFRRCHERLRSSRGMAMSLASFDTAQDTVTWLGVGSVEGLLVRQHDRAMPRQEVLLLRSGVVGYLLPQLRASTVPVMESDLLVFTTDGVRSGLDAGLNWKDSPQRIADRILAERALRTDDALALVVRYNHGQGQEQG